MDAFVILFTVILLASANGVLGTFLVLRKSVMIGDAISHAVLPGIVIAYYISHSRASFPILIGAAASGMVVTYLIQFFHQKVKLQQDASIGISYTFLFAIGIILISLFSGNVDLDQDCVLYGEIAYVPLDNLSIGGLYAGPRQVWILGTTLIIISTSVIVAYRKLVLTTFDPAFASAMGISVVLWQYYLMAGVSLTTVVSFESVGAVLVIAFLSGPAATAFLLTKDFKKMLYLAVGFGISASILGYYTAVWLAGSIAGAIATIIGLQFAIAFIYIQFLKKARISETLENKALTEV